MPDRLSIHAPTLINTIGHSAGAIIFGILLYLFFVDWRRNPSGRRMLPSVAAGLALLWNLGSLVGLATDPDSGFFADLIIAISFSILSFLPAVLLHISAGNSKPVIVAGYVLSCSAAVLHCADLLTGAVRYHHAAVLLITIGFGAITGAIVIRGAGRSGSDATRRLAGAMMLFLFSISFVHFGGQHVDPRHFGAGTGGWAWSGEIAFHHAGIPLALFVLLQDYRFLLLDTFIRFLVNACAAAAAIGIVVFLGIRFHVLERVTLQPFYAGLAFVAACVLLILFGRVRRSAQSFVTRSVFLRTNPESVSAQIQTLAAEQAEEAFFLSESAKLIAQFMGCDRFEWSDTPVSSGQGWAQAVIPLTFARGDIRFLCLGARRGGRVFLSEDLLALDGLALEIARQVDRLRTAEMQTLLTKGELQALQAQINPHFLFNTLNTIYGVIPRGNTQARNLILNLSDILRYSLSNERAFIRVEDEVRIVRAYLEIEQARLGPRLQTEIVVDERAAGVEIPAFSIQPLVENAVKHGAAARTGTGYVKLIVSVEEDRVCVLIANSGSFAQSKETKGHGVALKNVRRRLAICYGAEADFRIEGDADNTVIRFDVPSKALVVK